MAGDIEGHVDRYYIADYRTIKTTSRTATLAHAKLCARQGLLIRETRLANKKIVGATTWKTKRRDARTCIYTVASDIPLTAASLQLTCTNHLPSAKCQIFSVSHLSFVKDPINPVKQTLVSYH